MCPILEKTNSNLNCNSEILKSIRKVLPTVVWGVGKQ